MISTATLGILSAVNITSIYTRKSCQNSISLTYQFKALLT